MVPPVAGAGSPPQIGSVFADAHFGKVITWDEAMASNFQFCPNIDQLTDDSAPPVRADAQGRYPVPVPGQWTEI